MDPGLRRDDVLAKPRASARARTSLQLDLAQALFEVAVRGDRPPDSGSDCPRVTHDGSTSIRKSGFGCRKNGIE